MMCICVHLLLFLHVALTLNQIKSIHFCGSGIIYLTECGLIVFSINSDDN